MKIQPSVVNTKFHKGNTGVAVFVQITLFTPNFQFLPFNPDFIFFLTNTFDNYL